MGYPITLDADEMNKWRLTFVANQNRNEWDQLVLKTVGLSRRDHSNTSLNDQGRTLWLSSTEGHLVAIDADAMNNRLLQSVELPDRTNDKPCNSIAPHYNISETYSNKDYTQYNHLFLFATLKYFIYFIITWLKLVQLLKNTSVISV